MAAIAVPNYRKFSARSKQQEARGSLSAIYTAERTFYTEESTFSACLAYIGYNPVEKARNYSTGFPAYSGSVNQCGASGSQSCLAYSYDFSLNAVDICISPTDISYPETIKSNSSFVMLSVPGVGTPPSKFNFTAGASGNISPDLKTDEWTIDEGKNLINTTNGI